MTAPSTRLARAADFARWIVGVAATTAVVLLITLEGAADPTSLPTTASGQTIYGQRCAVCHGESGQGGIGPPLAGTVSVLYPDAADEVAVIAGGRRTMPPFSAILSSDEINAVVEFTRDGLG